ncbi:MAG: type II toxin-antitoxin system death-on-curing family toxin [Syntrophomonadaceae bacterium]|nr:type II toxin-antitoxin system death-on-curing family toxin [Syntrophomonadaceae bacterium]
MTMIKHISKKTVLTFHQQLIASYGGLEGMRDEGLLESALAQADVTMFGEHLHQDIFEMAAAYGYHLCQNPPFIDGNKRVALVVMDTFLRVNGWEITADDKAVYSMMLNLADSRINKGQLAEWLRGNCESRGIRNEQ